MKDAISDDLEQRRIEGPQGSFNGAFILKCGSARLSVIASEGGGWDHVSVSLKTRTPTWQEMTYVKRQFFRDDEVVMQLHPAKSEYVNCHPFCLHLWRPQTDEEIARVKKEWGDDWPAEYEGLTSPGVIPLPDPEMVGSRADI